jgi:hypothetical protein
VSLARVARSSRSALAGACLPAVLLAGVTAFGAAVPALGKLIR